MIIEIPNYIDQKTIDEIKESIKPYIDKTKSTASNRDGNTVIISNNPNLKALDEKLHKIFVKLQNEVLTMRYRPHYSSGDSGYEYHIYNPGDICHHHADGEFSGTSDPKISLLRYASVVVHLNTIEEGGELIFPEQNKKIKTEAGKIVIFPPYGMFSHYTTPSIEPREVIVTWYVYNGLTIMNSNIK